MGVKDYLVGKTASADTEDKIKKAVLELNAIEEITELDTMYIGSEKLLVHLDVNVKSVDPENLEQTINLIKKNIRKEVPIVYAIQIEINKVW